MLNYRLEPEKKFSHALHLDVTHNVLTDTTNHWRLTFLIEHLMNSKKFKGSFEFFDNGRLTDDTSSIWYFEFKQDAMLVRMMFD